MEPLNSLINQIMLTQVNTCRVVPTYLVIRWQINVIRWKREWKEVEIVRGMWNTVLVHNLDVLV